MDEHKIQFGDNGDGQLIETLYESESFANLIKNKLLTMFVPAGYDPTSIVFASKEIEQELIRATVEGIMFACEARVDGSAIIIDGIRPVDPAEVTMVPIDEEE